MHSTNAPRLGDQGLDIEMSEKLELVKIVTRADAYGSIDYSIVTVAGEHMVRANIGRYEIAREIAERIDADMLYERDHGSDSLKTI